MGRFQKEKKEDDQPKLRVSHAEANKQLVDRIAMGEQLLAIHPKSQEELAGLRERRKIWDDYNTQLLLQLFTTKSVSDEYNESPGMAVSSLRPSFTDLITYIHRDVKSSVTSLKSIVGRLTLYPIQGESNPPRSTGNAAYSEKLIFLVHGHDNAVKETVARFLEKFGLKVIILHEQADKGRTIIEKFEDHAAVGFAVILITADDIGGDCSSVKELKDLKPRGRQNVILEHGYFLGKLGRTHVCALKEEGIEVPSDLSGVLYIPLDSTETWKLRLAKEIKAAGIEIDLNQALS
jgi:predicted nucleotide-binding protein